MNKLVVIFSVISLVAGCAGYCENDVKQPCYGIDISHRQGKIDWLEVKNDSLSPKFVYVKASEGTTWVDPMFAENVNGAGSAGLHVGAYHFFRMSSSPKTQFETFRRQLGKVSYDLVPVIDVETYDGKTSTELKKSVGEFVAMFVKEYGYYPMIYGPEIAVDYMCPKDIVDSCMWFIGKPGNRPPRLSGGRRHAIWQYDSTGRVSGIPTKVDLDLISDNFSIEMLLVRNKQP